MKRQEEMLSKVAKAKQRYVSLYNQLHSSEKLIASPSLTKIKSLLEGANENIVRSERNLSEGNIELTLASIQTAESQLDDAERGLNHLVRRPVI
jgi:hypothetical protein